jgi:integrase
LRAYERRDPRTIGLILRVEPSGRKSLYFEHARGKRVRLGAFPNVTVDMARREIPNVLARLRDGLDPRPVWSIAATPKTSGHTLRELADLYTADYAQLKRAQGFSPRSLEVLTTVMKTIGDQPAEPFDVRAWQATLTKKRTARTANRKLDALRSLYTWALGHGLVTSNPCDGVKRLKVGNVVRERIRIPTPDEEAKLRATMSGYLLAAYLFARNTGLRLGELRHIRRDDIDDGGVHIRRSKTGKTRIVPLNDTARRALAGCPETVSGQLFPYAIKRAWRTARKAAQFEHTWNEATRHAFISELLRKGVAPFTVAKLAGHADLSMLNIYGHALHDDLAAAVGRLASS